MKMTGSEIFIESLVKEGVTTIFGIPGGSVIGLYDALMDSPIKNILTRHEQGAVHAADGYARVTGKTGVSLVTSGPGATNTVTGIATAFMDSVPLVVFTGQVPTSVIGNDAFQEADIVGITRPCTKHSYLVNDVNELARTIRQAFYIANSGKPGPVLVDLPKDVLSNSAEFVFEKEIKIRGYNPTYSGHMGQIKRIPAALAKAKKPVIYVGGGIVVSDASEELRKFAELTCIPVTTTLMGLGSFPGDHELSLGMLGMHGTYQANMAMTEADLVMAIGARFDDRITGKLDEFAQGAVIIHIDIDPSSISKTVPVNIPIVGDSKDVLTKLNAVIKKEKKNWKKDHKPWLDQIGEWEKTHPLDYKQGKEAIKPQYIVEQVYEATKGDAIIATDVGQHQMWAAQYYKFSRPREFLTSGGLGTMGYGFPAAIGAQIAFPERLVIDISGDGSFQMNIQELSTAVEHNLPVKVVILNNGFLGMVRQWQELFFNKRYSYTNIKSSLDFVKVAEAYGAVGLRIEKPHDVKKVLNKAFEIPKPVVIDCIVEREENVYPMVPVGKAIKEMLLA
jgi:acetolactate synthase-1/2/3 large subunit